MIPLNQLDRLPDGFLAASARTLREVLPGPALIHLPGRRVAPLFVSILLHGNEDTGLKAVQRVLRDIGGRELPRALSLFVGNVDAAAHNQRRMPGQPDFNRVWPGTETPALPEAGLMQQVVDAMRVREVFASIDIHNNTGLNPHYACLNRLDADHLHLAMLFSRLVVYFERPLGVQSAAFAPLCPAVTVECGKAGEGAADDHAARFIDAALHLERFPAHAVRTQDVDVYHTVATVKVPPDTTFSFDGAHADVAFVPDVDHLNFRDLEAGALLAKVRDGAPVPLEVQDAQGNAVFNRYFEVSTGHLRTRQPLTPSMLTQDAQVIRQDCLCYLMKRLRI